MNARVPPHLLDVVEGTHFGAEQMDDDAAGVDQHPVALAQALDANAGDAVRLQVLDDAVGDRLQMDIGAAGGHHHGFADR